MGDFCEDLSAKLVGVFAFASGNEDLVMILRVVFFGHANNIVSVIACENRQAFGLVVASSICLSGRFWNLA